QPRGKQAYGAGFQRHEQREVSVTPRSRRIPSLVAVALILAACSHRGEAGLRDGARTAITRFGETIQSLHQAAALTGGSGEPEQVAPVSEDGVATGATFVL